MKHLLLAHDLCGVGKVSLSTMLPVFERLGCTTSYLPTAIVSNTLDYGQAEIVDASDYMEKSLAIYENLGFQFDAICTGFLLSEKQVEILQDYLKLHPQMKIYIDPIMGDEGELYPGVGEATVLAMKRIIKGADLILPNYTEACTLADRKIEKVANLKQIEGLCETLAESAKAILITSVFNEEDGKHYVVGYEQGKMFALPFDYIDVRLPGTGDIFSALVVGEIEKGCDLKVAAQKAIHVVHDLIDLNKENEDKYFGIFVERDLKKVLPCQDQE